MKRATVRDVRPDGRSGPVRIGRDVESEWPPGSLDWERVFDSIALLDFLNSREDAALLWLVVAAALALWKLPALRPQLVVLVRQLFGRTLLFRLWLPAIVYTTALVAAAYAVDLWHTSSLKETAYWLVATGLVLAGKATQTHGNPDELRTLIRPALRLTILVEFFVGVYVFPLAVEMMLLPTVVLLVGTSVVAERDAKYAAAKKAIDWMLGVIGISMLVFVTVSVLLDLGGVFSAETAEKLFVAPVLTVAFVPFLYFVAVLVTYEHVFTHLDIYGTDRASVRRAKWALVRVCRLNLRKIGRLSHRFFPLGRSIEPDANLTELVRRFEYELHEADEDERQSAA